MATNETSFRKELIIAFRAHGFRVKNNSPELDKGKPDIYIRAKRLGFNTAAFLELKYGKNRSLSPSQREWIKEELRYGGLAAWVLCVKIGPTIWELYANTDVEALPMVQDKNYVTTRSRGEYWDVEALVRHLQQCGKSAC